MKDHSGKFAALLRGVNVGGANKVPMADLRDLATGLGWGKVQTYIASGNVVFEANGEADVLADQLRAALAQRMAVDVPVIVLTGDTVCAVTAACPIEDAGNRIHLFICDRPPSLDDVTFVNLIGPDEVVTPQGRFIWFHAPSGVGRSKLFARMEKVLGVAATARNLNTMIKLSKMVDER